MPASSRRCASGIARAVARPPDGATTRSARPWMTSVGAVICRSARVRLPGREDRAELAGEAVGRRAAIERQAEHVAQLGLVGVVAGRAGEREQL